MTRAHFQRFALILLVYTILVILWGAWVRISHSGDGCGDTWPLCHGQLIPMAEQGKTWVEYAHRLMSGLYGFIVLYFWWVARKIYPKGHFARKAALASLIFMITEASLGAKLVLFKLVGTNDTPLRAIFMALHQMNSFMLTGAVALTYAAAQRENNRPLASLPRVMSLFPWLIVLIGITGAWAALSGTLFPTQDLLQGLYDDFSQQAHYLVRLRVLHPILALLGGGSLSLFFWIQANTTKDSLLQKKSLQMALILFVGLCFGVLTLLSHAPIWMKLVHLTLAQIIWVTLLQWLYFVKDHNSKNFLR